MDIAIIFFSEVLEKHDEKVASLAPVLQQKELDVELSTIVSSAENITDSSAWLNNVLGLWQEKRSAQVCKWVNTWIGSLNESLLTQDSAVMFVYL